MNFLRATHIEILVLLDLFGILYVWHLWGPYVLDCVFSSGR